jgi:hypothetical protein
MFVLILANDLRGSALQKQAYNLLLEFLSHDLGQIHTQNWKSQGDLSVDLNF